MRMEKLLAKAIKNKNKSIDRAKNFIGGVRINSIENGIRVLTVYDWDKEYALPNEGYMESGKRMLEWCKIHNVHYYAKPHEQFRMFEATGQAKVIKCTAVIVEDMS